MRSTTRPSSEESSSMGLTSKPCKVPAAMGRLPRGQTFHERRLARADPGLVDRDEAARRGRQRWACRSPVGSRPRSTGAPVVVAEEPGRRPSPQSLIVLWHHAGGPGGQRPGERGAAPAAGGALGGRAGAAGSCLRPERLAAAAGGGLGALSDVALLYRLRGARGWLGVLMAALVADGWGGRCGRGWSTRLRVFMSLWLPSGAGAGRRPVDARGTARQPIRFRGAARPRDPEPRRPPTGRGGAPYAEKPMAPSSGPRYARPGPRGSTPRR
jgi:hypothetical protein